MFLLLAIGVGVTTSPVDAQPIDQVTATPESAAEAFLRSVRAIQWGTVALLLDDEPLHRIRATVTAVVAHDTTGAIGHYLVDTDADGLSDLSPAETFARTMTAVIGDMPGLMNALYDRDDEVIGSVSDGPDRAHAVYRTTARISGAVPEVKVMELRRTALGWRVHSSDEVGILEAALTGVGRE